MFRRLTIRLAFFALWLSALPLYGQGERIEIPDTGFTIVPPNGWEVQRNAGGSSLLFKAPKSQGDISYQPTIQVMVFNGFRYIDDVTQKEYGNLIVEKLGSVSNQVSSYRLRSEEKVTLQSGDEAILYYTEFQMTGVPLMQMHILISSAEHHFLMTYTDLAKVFEDENSQGLQVAYASMYSALLSSKPPSRFRFAIMGGAAVFVMLSLWFTFRWIRAYRMTRMGERLEEEDSREVQADEETEYYSRQSHLSQIRQKESRNRDDDDERMSSHVSEVSHVSEAMPEPKRKSVAPPRKVQVEATEPPSKTTRGRPTSTKAPTPPPPPSTIAETEAPSSVHDEAESWHGSEAPEPPAPPPRPALAKATPPAPPKAKPMPPKPAAQAPKTKPPASKVAPASAVSTLARSAPEAEENLTEEARLSEILPQAGAIETKKSKKKRGLFWRKSEDEEVEEPQSEAVSDVWALPKSGKHRDDEDEAVSSVVAKAPKTKAKPQPKDEDDVEGDADEWVAEAEPTPSRTKSQMPDPDEDDAHPVSEAWGVDEKTVKSGPKGKSRPKDEEEAEPISQAWPIDEKTVKAGSAKPKARPQDDGDDDPDGWNVAPSESTKPRGQNSLLNETRPQRLIRPAAGGAAAAASSAAPVSVPMTDDGWNLGPSADAAQDEDEDEDDR